MRGVYRHSPSESIACGLAVLFFAAVLALLLALAWTYEPVQSPWGLSALVVCVFGSMLILSLWGLLARLLGRLEIDDGLIVRSGPFSTESVCLSSLTAIHWRGYSVILVSPGGRLRIPLDLIERCDVLEFVRCVRKAIPLEQQSGWEWFFCWNIVPLLRCKSLPGPGEVAIKRHRWDVIFAIALIPGTAAAWFISHVTQQPRMVLIPLFLLPVWLPVRWSTPRHGMIVRSSTDNSNGERPFMLFMVSVLPLTFAGIIAHKLYGDLVPFLNSVLVGGALLLLAAMLAIGTREDRRLQARRQSEQAELVARYDWITGWPHEIDFERRTNLEASS